MQTAIAIKGTTALVAFVYLFVSGVTGLFGGTGIKITSWNGFSTYQGVINGKQAVIQLEGGEPERPIKKDKKSNEDGSREREYFDSRPGKIKITYKSDNKGGTSLVYERDMGTGEISKTDQAYIRTILDSIEKFHKDNRSYAKTVKDRLGNIWKEVNKKRR